MPSQFVYLPPWLGTVTRLPFFLYILCLPLCRAKTKSSRSSTAMISFAVRRGNEGDIVLDGNLNGGETHRFPFGQFLLKRKTVFNMQADGIFDVFHCFFVGCSLRVAPLQFGGRRQNNRLCRAQSRLKSYISSYIHCNIKNHGGQLFVFLEIVPFIPILNPKSYILNYLPLLPQYSILQSHSLQ